MRRKKTPPAVELKKSWEEWTGRRSGHILRRKKTPPAAELKKGEYILPTVVKVLKAICCGARNFLLV